LKPDGTCVVVTGPDGRWLGPLARFISALALSPFVSQKLVPFVAKPNQEDLRLLRDLIAAGTITPVIDKYYGLQEASEAMRYIETGHARGKVVITMALLFMLAITAAGLSAAGPETKAKAPRTENGQPDLQGVWNFSSDVPLQRAAAFAGKKILTKEEFDEQAAKRRNGLRAVVKFAPIEDIGLDWIDNEPLFEDLRSSLISYPETGRLPKLMDGVRREPSVEDIGALLGESKDGPPPALLALISAFQGGAKDSVDDFNLAARCLTGENVPFAPQLDNNQVQIIQSKDHVVFLTDGARRIIPIDARPRVSEKFRTWSGDSRGHWEADTLVIETTNFSRRARSFSGAGNGYDKMVVERFTRRSKGAIEYEATIVDPKTFTDKIVVSFPMARMENGHLYEWACHEGNYSLKNALSGARAEEERATTAK
jgi:hypothetical protein